MRARREGVCPRAAAVRACTRGRGDCAGAPPSAAVQGDALLSAARAAGVVLQERRLHLEELLALAGDGGAAMVVLVDVRRLRGREGGYFGHFMPLVGCTRDSVLLHDSTREAPQARLRVARAAFDAARRAEGTDEDIILVRARAPGACSGAQ